MEPLSFSSCAWPRLRGGRDRHTFNKGQWAAAHALLEEDGHMVLIRDGANGGRHADGVRRHVRRHIKAVVECDYVQRKEE
jgi:hypothetical protein